MLQSDNRNQTETIEIVVNGEKRALPSGQSLLGLLAILNLDPARVAIELDRKIVRQPEWEATMVAHGSVVEIVQFVGGG